MTYLAQYFKQEFDMTVSLKRLKKKSPMFQGFSSFPPTYHILGCFERLRLTVPALKQDVSGSGIYYIVHSIFLLTCIPNIFLTVQFPRNIASLHLPGRAPALSDWMPASPSEQTLQSQEK